MGSRSQAEGPAAVFDQRPRPRHGVGIHAAGIHIGKDKGTTAGNIKAAAEI